MEPAVTRVLNSLLNWVMLDNVRVTQSQSQISKRLIVLSQCGTPQLLQCSDARAVRLNNISIPICTVLWRSLLSLVVNVN